VVVRSCARGLLFDVVALANLKGVDTESALRKAVRELERGLSQSILSRTRYLATVPSTIVTSSSVSPYSR